MLVGALWRGFGPRAALAGAIMILLDPTMIIHSRLDWGPNALMFFFRGLLVLAIVNWLRTLDVRWAWVAVITEGLGIFDKLSFIWMACAAMSSLLFIFPDKLKIFTRQHRMQALVLIVITSGGLAASIIRGVILAEHLDMSWGNRIIYAIHLIRLTIPGGGALNFIAGDGLRIEKTFWLAYLLPIILGIFGVRKFIKEARQKKLLLWLATLVSLVMIAFTMTKTATGPHHASMLCGLWQLLLAPLVAMAWNSLESKITSGKIAYITSLLLIAAGSITVVITAIQAFSKPINTNWDPVNFQAVKLVEKYSDANFVFTDWGMGTLAVGLSSNPYRIYDKGPTFSRREEAIEFFQSIDRKHDTYIYSLLPGFENFKWNRENLFYILQLNNIKPVLYKTYSNWQGKAMIEILYIPALQRK